MICPHCCSDNREGAKFCNECGFPLIGKIAETATCTETDGVSNEFSVTSEEKPRPTKSDKPVDSAEELTMQQRHSATSAQATLAHIPSIETEETHTDEPTDTFRPSYENIGKTNADKDKKDNDIMNNADLSGFDECVVDSCYIPPRTSWRSGDTMEMPRVEDQTKGSHKDFRAPDDSKTKRGKGKIVFAIALCLTIAGGATAGITYSLELWGGKTIPDVVGMTEFDAMYVLEDKGFLVQTVQVKSDEIEGIVLDMDPKAGARQELGTEVTVHVSVARTIPDIVGWRRQDALAMLSEYGFTNVSFATEKSDEYEDMVLGITPETGIKAKADEPIVLTVATPYRVPDVSGLSREDAVAALEEAGLVATCVFVYNDSIADGTLLETMPKAGEKVSSGSTVTVSIARSRGSELESLTRTYLSDVNMLILGDITYEIQSVDSVSYQGNDTVSFTVSAAAVANLDGETVRGSVKQKSGVIVWNDTNNIVSIS